MGLDTLAYHEKERTPLDDSLFGHIPPVLVGGMFSGNGNGASFRGKVYSDFVEHATGESLYQETIPNLTVHKMVAALEDFLQKFPEEKTYEKMDMSKNQAEALLAWFKVVANNNGEIVGWW